MALAQIVDNTAGQADVAKDFLIGCRAAWQEVNNQGGINGYAVEHLVIETDASAGSLRDALDLVKKTAHCVALSGTVGDRAAGQLVGLLKQTQFNMAHVAPWMQNSELDGDAFTFPIFASRQEQIAKAFQQLSVMGVAELAAIYASEQEYTQYRSDVERAAASLNIRLQTYKPAGDLALVGKKLTVNTPRILLFLGGTPELVQFLRGIDKQARQRYVIALADVNLQTMMQMGASRITPVMATQVVPMVNASFGVVRAYRDTLGRLYDEPPTPQSLAGYIAARYTAAVLKRIDGLPTRQSALLAFQQRQPIDLDGFRVSFNAQGRSGAYVTQSMITPDGRLIG
ncbi:MAG: ABC transporter substrate-binding protein [Rhodoferax sp.]|uniref:ABC transporter substrate-binding protein n=1 Tax=Rhodoferax sp. TaxID=50421 RepID=UPI0026179E25|nr:ABC transporter substrate-binding protein [Rhodoferax sp.]MDD2879338.1 ABC transporter substrate-binding protein [Rhodoferax sp.]